MHHETARTTAIANLNPMRDRPDYNDQNLNDNEISERQSSSTEEPFHSSRSGRRRKVLSRLSTEVGKIGDCNDQNLNNKYARLRITIQRLRVVVCGEQPAAERFLFHSVREITERQTSCAKEPFYSSRSGRRRKVLLRHPTQVGKTVRCRRHHFMTSVCMFSTGSVMYADSSSSCCKSGT